MSMIALEKNENFLTISVIILFVGTYLRRGKCSKSKLSFSFSGKEFRCNDPTCVNFISFSTIIT